MMRGSFEKKKTPPSLLDFGGLSRIDLPRASQRANSR